MDNGFLLASPIQNGKAGFLFVPMAKADNINKAIIFKNSNTQFKEGDLITFHRTEGEKFGDKILLHETQIYGHERKQGYFETNS